jgi:hypothetical protein
MKEYCVNVTQTFCVLTFEYEFMMLTLSFRMSMFFVCLGDTSSHMVLQCMECNQELIH